jgi:hypothetical protein
VQEQRGEQGSAVEMVCVKQQRGRPEQQPAGPAVSSAQDRIGVQSEECEEGGDTVVAALAAQDQERDAQEQQPGGRRGGPAIPPQGPGGVVARPRPGRRRSRCATSRPGCRRTRCPAPGRSCAARRCRGGCRGRGRFPRLARSGPRPATGSGCPSWRGAGPRPGRRAARRRCTRSRDGRARGSRATGRRSERPAGSGRPEVCQSASAEPQHLHPAREVRASIARRARVPAARSSGLASAMRYRGRSKRERNPWGRPGP